MNEFEWRRQLRGLRQPKMPDRNLWPAIEAALGAELSHARIVPFQPSPRPRWMLASALAASLALASGVGWHVLRPPAAESSTAAASNWKPADPRLAGAAIELDAARMELELAMQQAPDSAALRRLLHRTEQQETQLRHLADRAS
ncbi:MAG TPA: hypothetical protein VGN24_03525 [Rhodanobacter sp.]|jgi:hypothetical protein|nr:hypothetical protein [Rhodanobacter sp.]